MPNIVTRSYGVAGRKSCVQAMLLQWWTITVCMLVFSKKDDQFTRNISCLVLSCLVTSWVVYNVWPAVRWRQRKRIHIVLCFLSSLISWRKVHFRRTQAMAEDEGFYLSAEPPIYTCASPSESSNFCECKGLFVSSENPTKPSVFCSFNSGWKGWTMNKDSLLSGLEAPQQVTSPEKSALFNTSGKSGKVNKIGLLGRQR